MLKSSQGVGDCFHFPLPPWDPNSHESPKRALKLEQCLFNKRLPSKINVMRFNIVWSLMRGVTLWAIWLECNDLVFQNVRWHEAKLWNIMWQGLAWNKLRDTLVKNIGSWITSCYLCTWWQKTERWDGVTNHLVLVRFIGRLWGLGWPGWALP
jgi:hypothetical protein